MTQYTRVASWRWHLVDAPSPGAKRTGSIRLLLGPWMTNVCISFFLRKHVAQGLVFVWWVVVQKKSQGSEIKDEWIPNFSGKLEGSCSNNTTMLDTFQGNQHNVTTGWYHLHWIYTKISQWSDSICNTLVEPFFRWMFFGSFLLYQTPIQSISWKVWSDFSFAYVSFHSPNKIISLTRELLETTWAGRATTTSSDGRILLGIAMVQSLWDTLTFTAIQAAKIPLQSGPQ